jgi:tetratricopeptide (TPR) repeat protein
MKAPQIIRHPPTRRHRAAGRVGLLGCAGVLVSLCAQAAWAIDAVALWDFTDPARSEATFRARLPGASADDALSLQTQIARSLGLRSQFDDAHQVLDQVEAQLARAGAEPRVRYLLERGRTLRSSGQRERARPLFLQAVEQARAARLDELTIDAMHMVALVEPGAEAPLRWKRHALELALGSREVNARNWDASLANNIGMTLYEQGRFEDALASFTVAVQARERIGQPRRLHEARWMVAWTLRALKRHDDALRLLSRLESQAPEPDAHVFAELGENHLALGQRDEATAAFARAWELFGRAPAAQRPSAAELDRLRRLGGR